MLRQLRSRGRGPGRLLVVCLVVAVVATGLFGAVAVEPADVFAAFVLLPDLRVAFVPAAAPTVLPESAPRTSLGPPRAPPLALVHH